MKIFERVAQSKSSSGIGARCRWLALVAGAAIGCGASLTSLAQAVRAPGRDGEEVQTRGPVHEAFAGVVAFNPEAGVVVTKTPPEPIEEMPPEERPEGENVTWIPGYWSWDDERNDYMWISGTWRDLPPGRAWIAGYWGRTGQGYQWTSGYWVDAAQREATYLPAPPTSIETGPNVPAPSQDYIWTPGCWIWASGRYAWRPGYWVLGRPDWEWVPAHYTWTPRGHIFVGGYWDYPVERRGVLFAPVYFAPHLYVRPHFAYSPSIVIDLNVFNDHLFCRPRYHHYYFGDYYAPTYVHSGFYASFSFHIGHHGYDPIYSHHRWEHRHERDWDRHLEASYRDRRDHEDARPPRTWVQQQNITINKTVNKVRVDNRTVVADTYEQYRNRGDNRTRFQPVAREERQRLTQLNREVQSAREQRQTVELRAPERDNNGVRSTEVRAVTAQIPKSAIVAKPVKESRRVPPPIPEQQVQTRREAQGREGEARRERQERERERTETRQLKQEPQVQRQQPQAQVQPQVQSAPQQRQQPERQVQTVPQPQQRVQPAPQAQQRRVPSMPQQRREEKPVAPERMAQSPVVITEESQRNARAAEVRRNQPPPPDKGKQGKKGAEHLKEGGKKDREDR